MLLPSSPAVDSSQVSLNKPVLAVEFMVCSPPCLLLSPPYLILLLLILSTYKSCLSRHGQKWAGDEYGVGLGILICLRDENSRVIKSRKYSMLVEGRFIWQRRFMCIHMWPWIILQGEATDIPGPRSCVGGEGESGVREECVHTVKESTANDGPTGTGLFLWDEGGTLTACINRVEFSLSKALWQFLGTVGRV